MSTHRSRYQELLSDINKTFSGLIKNPKEYNFIEVIQCLESANEDDRIQELFEMGEQGGYLPYLERRNNTNGNVIPCYVISVSNSSICVIDEHNENITKLIKFEDLADITDRMDLIDAMLELD